MIRGKLGDLAVKALPRTDVVTPRLHLLHLVGQPAQEVRDLRDLRLGLGGEERRPLQVRDPLPDQFLPGFPGDHDVQGPSVDVGNREDPLPGSYFQDPGFRIPILSRRSWTFSTAESRSLILDSILEAKCSLSSLQPLGGPRGRPSSRFSMRKIREKSSPTDSERSANPESGPLSSSSLYFATKEKSTSSWTSS